MVSNEGEVLEIQMKGPLKLEGKVAAIPVQFGSPNTSGHFLGESVNEVQDANLIKLRLNNWLPPPDRGTFQDNFEANAERLIARIKEIYSPRHGSVAESSVPAGGDEGDSDGAGVEESRG